MPRRASRSHTSPHPRRTGRLVALATVAAALLVPATATAQYATGGNGRFLDNIYWFSWGTNGTPITTATTRTNTYTVGAAVFQITCNLSAPSTPLTVYRPGQYIGDAFDEMYNIGGTGNSNNLIVGLRTGSGAFSSFTFACSATLNGSPFPLKGLVYADAEQNSPLEYERATSTGTWRIVDRYRTPGCTIPYPVLLDHPAPGQNRLRMGMMPGECATGPAGVAFIEGATSATVEMQGGGASAIALGVLLDNVDRSDAPASYGEAAHVVGASFTGGTVPDGTTDIFDAGFVLANLVPPSTRLGALVDVEAASLASANADGDDLDNSDDEDAIAPIGTTPMLAAGQTYAVGPVACSGTDPVHGWIDWNRDGDFTDAGEASAVVNCAAGTASLNWTVPATVRSGQSFVRLRTAASAAEIAVPSGFATTGEVEDHAFVIRAAQLTLVKQIGARQYPADQFRVTVADGATTLATATSTGTNTSASATTPVSPNATITLGEAMAAGSVATIGSYVGAIACTNAGAGGAIVPVGAPPAWTVIAPAASDITCTITNTTQATLAVTKSDAQTTYTPGTGATYTIVVTNPGGPSAATGVALTDTLPAGVTIAGSVSCIVAGTASCGTVTGAVGGSSVGVTGASVGPGAAHSLTLQIPVAFSPGMTTNPLVNTVNVTATNATAATANDTDTLVLAPDISVAKTDNQSIYTPGTVATYVVDTTNAGPSNATGVTAADNLPAGVTLTGPPTCVVLGTGTCGTITGAAGGSTFSVTGASVAAGVGNRLRYSLPVAFNAGMTTNPLVNTVTANATGQASPVTANDSDTLQAITGLTVGKTDNSDTYTPGTTATYVVTITNAGPSNAFDVDVTDPLPAGVTLSGTPTCTAAGIATCGIIVGSVGATTFAANNGTIAAGAGNSLTYSVPVAIAASVTANPLVNTATATDPGDATPDSGSDSDTRRPRTALAITKTDGSARYTPGTTATYTIVVTNDGPSNAEAITIADTLPPGVTLTATPTCVAAGDAACGTTTGTAGGTTFGSTGAGIDAGADNELIVTVPVAFASSLTTDPLVNTVTASDPGDPTPAAASDSDALAKLVGLTITKDDGSPTYTPGRTATYTIVVTNAGPSDATAVAVTDTLPAGVTLTAAPTCAPTGAATCGAVTGAPDDGAFGMTGGTIAAGGGNALTLQVPVRFAPDLTANPLVNTASATDPSDPTDNRGSDSDARDADVVLAVTKDDGSLTYTPGGTATYTIVVTNTGATLATGVTLDDLLPAGVTLSGAATCTAFGSASCGTIAGASGGNEVTLTGASLLPGQPDNRLQIVVPVAFDPSLAADPLTNTVSVASPDDPAGADAHDSDTLQAVAGLTITKTDNAATYTPGGTATYVLVVTNAGPSAASNTTVADTLPAGVTLTGTPTCVAAGGALCGTIAGGAGGAAFTATGAAIPAGAGARLTYSLPVAFAANLTADPLANTATANDPSDPTTASATDADDRRGGVALTLTKTDGSATYVPGTTATYTITIGNAGPTHATRIGLADGLPDGVTLTATPTCVAAGTATCGFVSGAAGGTTLAMLGGAIAAGPGNTLTITVPVAFDADLATDPLVNVAAASDPDDPDGATASDSDTLAVQTSLGVSKTDGSPTYAPGGVATYTIVVTNAGPSAALDVDVDDPLPAGVTLFATPTCTAAGTATCGTIAGTAGTSTFAATGATIAAGAANSLTYTVPVQFAPGMTTDPLVNTVTVTDPGDPTPGTASDSDARASVTDLAVVKAGPPTIPGGSTITYTLTLTNNGPDAANGATYDDPMPAGIANVAASCTNATGGAVCGAPDVIGNTVSGVVKTFPPGASATITITGTAPTGTQTLVNTATIAPPAGTTDSNDNNDTSTTSTTTPVTLLHFDID